MSAAQGDPAPDEFDGMFWLEQLARVVQGLAARREAGASDRDMVDLIAATIRAAVLYALAFEGASLDEVLARANAGLPVKLYSTAPLVRGGQS